MKQADTIIDIETLVLTGNPADAAIEAEVARALRETDAGTLLARSKGEVPIAREVTRSVAGAVKPGKV
jgi:hypothetical protein